MNQYQPLNERNLLKPQSVPSVGFSTNVFDNPYDVVGHLAFLADHFQAIELEIAEESQKAILDSSPEEYRAIVDGVRALYHERDLDLSVHAVWFGRNTNLAADNVDAREASMALLKRSIDFAGDVGVPTLTYHPGQHRKLPNSRLLANLKQSVGEMAAYASEKGVLLCMENMGADRPAFVILDAAEHVELFEATGTAMTLDVIHLASIVGIGPAFDEALEQLMPYVRIAHVADMPGTKHAHLPMGEGDFPLADVLDRMGRLGFDGAAIIEEFTKGWAPELYLERAIAFRHSYEARRAA